MALPLDIRDLMSSGSKLREERERPVRIAVFVDAHAPDVAIDRLKSELHPQTGNARLHVEPVVPGDVLDVDSTADVVIALTGPGDVLAASLAHARDRYIPTVLVALEGDRDAVSRRLAHPLLDTVADEDADQTLEKLGRWLGEKAATKRLALAANFAFVRRAVAEEAVKNTSFQNAVIGGVAFIPGADLPLMTANQAKMVMQIAAIYGQPLGAERVKELATVVGGAFAMRAIARQAAAFIPGFGWAIKAGIGYSGTLAMGYAAIEYFEGGGDIRGLGERLKAARDEAVSKATRKRRGEPIEATAWVAGEEPAELPAVEPPAPSAPDTNASNL